MTEANTGCARNQGSTQFCAEAVEAHKELREAQAEIERLKARVGWLDHLDTPEGRAMHATEAVKVENEELRADLIDAMELLRAHGAAAAAAASLAQADALMDAIVEAMANAKEAT